jgi:hypothetical protein
LSRPTLLVVVDNSVFKQCSKCKQSLPVSQFSYSAKTATGFSPSCKACRKALHVAEVTTQVFQQKRDARREYKKNYDKEQRLIVLKHYSNNTLSCACCGESHYEFLCIDHINGGGNKHRKTLSKQGNNLGRWLLKNNFPEGFQVLCHNCNMAKGFHGACPHTLEQGLNKAA